LVSRVSEKIFLKNLEGDSSLRVAAIAIRDKPLPYIELGDFFSRVSPWDLPPTQGSVYGQRLSQTGRKFNLPFFRDLFNFS